MKSFVQRLFNFRNITVNLFQLTLLVMFIGMLWYIVSNFIQSTHVLQVKLASTQLMDALANEESGQRGYLYYGSRQCWRQYDTGKQQVAIRLHALETLLANDYGHPDSYVQVRHLISEKELEMEQTIRLYDGHDEEDALKLVKSEKGVLLMKDIRLQLRIIAEEESTRLFRFFGAIILGALPLGGVRTRIQI